MLPTKSVLGSENISSFLGSVGIATRYIGIAGTVSGSIFPYILKFYFIAINSSYHLCMQDLFFTTILLDH